MTANETVKSRYIEPLNAESVWCVSTTVLSATWQWANNCRRYKHLLKLRHSGSREAQILSRTSCDMRLPVVG